MNDNAMRGAGQASRCQRVSRNQRVGATTQGIEPTPVAGRRREPRGGLGTLLLAALFLAAGCAKLAGADLMIRQFDVVGLGQGARYVVGSVEIVAGLCFLSRRLAVVGALLASGITVGVIGVTIGHAARLVTKAPAAGEPQLTVSRGYQA